MWAELLDTIGPAWITKRENGILDVDIGSDFNVLKRLWNRKSSRDFRNHVSITIIDVATRYLNITYYNHYIFRWYQTNMSRFGSLLGIRMKIMLTYRKLKTKSHIRVLDPKTSIKYSQKHLNALLICSTNEDNNFKMENCLKSAK